MPRKPTDSVTEHRVTLGDFERTLLKETQDARNVRDIGVGVGIAAVGIGGTYVAYKIGKAMYDWGEDAVEFMTEPIYNEEGDKGPPRWVRWLAGLP